MHINMVKYKNGGESVYLILCLKKRDYFYTSNLITQIARIFFLSFQGL